MTLAPAIAALRIATEQGLTLPPAVNVWQWAEMRRRLSKEVSAVTGSYRVANAPFQREPQEAFTDPTVQTTVMCWGSRLGKALATDTPILTTRGWKTMGTIEVGDYVFSPRGRPVKVLFTSDIQHGRPCNLVLFNDGSKIVADDDHLWTTTRSVRRRINARRSIIQEVQTATTSEIAKTLTIKNSLAHAIHVCFPIELESSVLPLPPYTLGAWLGDGHNYSGSITFHESDKEILNHIKADGFDVRIYRDNRNLVRQGFIDYPANSGKCKRGHESARFKQKNSSGCKECNRLWHHKTKHGIPLPEFLPTFWGEIQKLGLARNKHIPDLYLRASVEQRFELLRGLMDTDGCAGETGCEFCSTSKKLATGVLEIVIGLGFKATLRESDAKIYGRVVGKKYRVHFNPTDRAVIFKLARKQSKLKPDREVRHYNRSMRRIKSITRTVVSVPVRCIQVDSEDHLYLAGRSLIATHNTETENNLIGYKVEFDPCNILFCWPTIDRSKIWSKQILAPMVRSIPQLRDRIKESRSKDADNTLLSKRFPGGTLSAIGSNSPSGFRGTQAPVVVGDEIDAMENNLEGDPVLLLLKRAENHPDSIQVLSSSPTLKGASRIWSWLERSDFRKWFVPCAHCGAFILLLRRNLKWPEGKPQLAEYECDACARMLNDRQRFDMVMAGEWRATKPFSGIRGYWLNGLNSPFPTKKGYVSKLHQFASEIDEHKAQGEEAMITLTNTFDAECYEIVSQSASAEELFARCEDYAPLPDEVLMITAGGDVQEDRIEALAVGWGEEEQAWCLEHRVFTGDTEQREVFDEYDAWLLELRKREDGIALKVAQAFLDSGFNSKAVYAFTRKREHRKVYASKGARWGPISTTRPTRRNEQGAGVFTIGTNTAKTNLFHRLKITVNGPRKIHFPKGRGFSEDWFEQFTAEHLVLERVNGFPAYVWQKKDENARNEALDCFVGAFAAMAQLRPNWAALKKRLEKSDEPKEYTLTEGGRKAKPETGLPPPISPPSQFVRPPRRTTAIRAPTRH